MKCSRWRALSGTLFILSLHKPEDMDKTIASSLFRHSSTDDRHCGEGREKLPDLLQPGTANRCTCNKTSWHPPSRTSVFGTCWKDNRHHGRAKRNTASAGHVPIKKIKLQMTCRKRQRAGRQNYVCNSATTRAAIPCALQGMRLMPQGPPSIFPPSGAGQTTFARALRDESASLGCPCAF